MRALQIFPGLLIVLLGVLLLLATSGLVSMSAGDVAGLALIISGVFFWIPGFVWRQNVPWLTVLFVPGSLALAVGGIVVYTERTDLWAWTYLWALLPVALGLAFLAMYYVGPRARALEILGIFLGAVGVLSLGLLMAILGREPMARTLGSLVLIALGLALALGTLLPRKK